MKSKGESAENEDPTNKLLDVQTQLEWLSAIGFQDVDCYWKWFELALLTGYLPPLIFAGLERDLNRIAACCPPFHGRDGPPCRPIFLGTFASPKRGEICRPTACARAGFRFVLGWIFF